jgi:hypothetical protein
MRKLTTAVLVLTLVLGGVALAVAADGPQENTGLSGLQKLTDQEAREVRGLGMDGFGPSLSQVITTAPHAWNMTQVNNPSNGIFQRDRVCPPAPPSTTDTN